MNDEPSGKGPSGPTGAPPPDGVAQPAPTPGLGALRAAGIFAAFLGVQLLVVVAAAVWVYTGHAGGGGGAGEGSRIAPGFLLAAALAGTALSGFVALRMTRRALPGALAVVGWVPASLRACARAATQGVGLVVALAALSAFLPAPKQGLGPLGRLDELGLWACVAGVALVLVAAPFVEELVFRGVLYTGLASRFPPPVAAVATTLAFVALHVPQLAGYWPGWLFVGLVGALALRARIATRSLLPAIALHASYNLGLVLAAAMR